MPAATSSAFELIDPAAAGPVIVSVPHAGRDYPPDLSRHLRCPLERLMTLEDRLVDQVARGLQGAPTLIARQPRLWIDLNRDEAEVDRAMMDRWPASRSRLTPKVRGGLGLVPRRLNGVGDIWRRPIAAEDLETRIATVHRPYHEALAALLHRALRQHGMAVLIDLHSMPPLRQGLNAEIVIGNLHGQSAAGWVTARVAAMCVRAGLNWAENAPYPGAHMIERHGRPACGVHAIQLEIDRSLYLDDALDGIEPVGLARMRSLFAAIVDDLSATALPIAAE